MAAFGRSNCAMLNRLKHSARNCSCLLSLIRNSLNTEKSKFTRPGPYKMFRPELPYVNGAGVANADVSNHRSTVGFDNVPSPTRSGRLPVPVLTVGALSVGVYGKPV